MIVTRPMISSETALRLVQSAVAEAQRNGWSVAVCVVDPHGQMLAAARMDDATPPVLEFAQDKAFTAATMRRATAAFSERMHSSPALKLGFSNRARLMVWGGGLPITHEGSVVGGIGVSGAQDFEDIACAELALRAEGLGWEL